MTVDLAAFLQARLDEDERIARAAGAGEARDGAGVWTRARGLLVDDGTC